MPIINTLLVRAAYGWDEATRATSIAAHGRKEALYGLGANNSPADVAQVASKRLDIIAEPRYQYDAEHTPPTDAELAYHGYGTLDRLPTTAPGGGPSDELVVSIAVQENDLGIAYATVSLHDLVLWASPLENFVALLSQATKKMIPGTGRGDWKEAQPVTPPAVPPLIGITPGGVVCIWNAITDQPFTNAVAAASLAGLIFVIGTGAPGVLQSYDPVSTLWTAEANLPFNVTTQGMAFFHEPAAGSAAYAIYSDGGAVNEIALYSGAGGIWITSGIGTAMPTARSGVASCIIGSAIHVIGGFGGLGASTAHEVYSTTTHLWTTKAALPQPMYACSCMEIGGDIYLFGSNASFSTALAYKWDHVGDSWSALPTPPYAPSVNFPVAAPIIVGSELRILVGGGGSSSFWTYSLTLGLYQSTGASAGSNITVSANDSTGIYGLTFANGDDAEVLTCGPA